MDMISKATFLFVLDVLIRMGSAVAVIYLLWNVYASLRRGYVFIYGKVASKIDEPLGYWLGVACWLGAGGVLAMIAFRGL